MFLGCKRRKILFITCALLVIVWLFSCSSTVVKGNEKLLTVNYIDVGNGDCTLITLPDGKSMLIDTGANNSENRERVLTKMESRLKRLDYLVLTTLDNAHISNAENVIENFKINKAFVPQVLDRKPFATFDKIYNKLEEKGVEIKISQAYLNLSTKDYTLVFLSPLAKGADSSYTEFNHSDTKTQTHINNLSPIIYLEYKGVRFLFTSDAEKSQEELVLNLYRNGLYSVVFNDGRQITLEDIEFYKLSNHGSSISNGIEFLNEIKPQNAIISAGGSARPSTQVLKDLISVNGSLKVYRTDADKSVRVVVNAFGKYQVFKGE